jgi:hypothetical protein
MVNIDGGKDGEPKATVNLWFAIALFTTIVGVIFFIANMSGRIEGLEKDATECKAADSSIATGLNVMAEKLTRIDERQQNVIIRLDAISANLRAHVVGDSNSAKMKGGQ